MNICDKYFVLFLGEIGDGYQIPYVAKISDLSRFDNMEEAKKYFYYNVMSAFESLTEEESFNPESIDDICRTYVNVEHTMDNEYIQITNIKHIVKEKSNALIFDYGVAGGIRLAFGCLVFKFGMRI